MIGARTAVVVPTHKNVLSDYDEFSFARTRDVYAGRDVFVVCGESVDTNRYFEINPRAKIERFSDEYFKSNAGYNRMCLTHEFYERFSAYDYMLICQLDAIALRDGLDEWTLKDYDYVGAPFCHLCDMKFKCLHEDARKKPDRNMVGNGGFSLRRIQSFLKLTENGVDFEGNEDLVIRNCSWFSFPPCRDALWFSLESYAPAYFKCGVRPQGMHNMVKLYPRFSRIERID